VPHVLDDEQGRRAVVELFARLGADALAHPVATRARLLGFGQVVLDALAGQMIGQRSAPVTTALRRCGRRCGGRWVG